MQLSGTRAVISLLAAPFYAWIKAMAFKYFHVSFDPSTDMMVASLLSAFGLVPKNGKVKP